MDATSGDAADSGDACICPDSGIDGTQGQSTQGYNGQGSGPATQGAPGTQGFATQGVSTQGAPPGPSTGCPCGNGGPGLQGQQGVQGQGWQNEATQGAGGFQGAGGDGGSGFMRRHRARRPTIHCVPVYPGSPWLSCT